MRRHVLRRWRSDLSTDLVLLLIERLLLGGCDVTAVLLRFETLFLADELVLRVQCARLERSNLAVAKRLIDSPVLDFEASIHLGPAGMVLCPPSRSQLAGAGDKAQRRDDDRKAGLLRHSEHWLSPSVSGVLISTIHCNLVAMSASEV